MAKIVFSEAAASLAHVLTAQMPLYDEPTEAIVAIRWSSGARDNQRGPNGEVVWEVTESPSWVCEVAPWGKSKGNPMERYTIKVDDLNVLLVNPERATEGILFVDAADGAFSVEHRAI